MVTGSRGVHVVCPLRRGRGYQDVHGCARALAEAMVADDPEHLTLEWHKAERGKRIYVDVNRIAYAQHAVAPYGVRAKPGAPVAMPIHWDELDDRKLKPDRWTVRTAADRLEAEGDRVAGHRATGADAARRAVSGVRVERIPVEATRPLRRAVLRPFLELEQLAGSEPAGAVAFGVLGESGEPARSRVDRRGGGAGRVADPRAWRRRPRRAGAAAAAGCSAALVGHAAAQRGQAACGATRARRR